MSIGFSVPRAAAHLACALAFVLVGCGAPEDGTVNEESHQCVGGPKFDPAGTKNVGNGHGGQFIGGQCLSAADCASGCCALPCGICSGPGAQFQAGKQGCGFVSHQPPTQQPPPQQPPAPPAECSANGAPGPTFDPAGTKNVGNGHGVQFIGGQCLSAADCASGCCALPCGICSGPGAQFQAGKQGCGFDAKEPPTQQPPTQQPPTTQPPAPPAQCSADGAPGPHFDPAGEKNVGNGHGAQFIGGQCLSSKDCASGCCALPCGICSGPGAQFQAGKQGCGFGG
jgi:hypothetical protein